MMQSLRQMALCAAVLGFLWLGRGALVPVGAQIAGSLAIAGVLFALLRLMLPGMAGAVRAVALVLPFATLLSLAEIRSAPALWPIALALFGLALVLDLPRRPPCPETVFALGPLLCLALLAGNAALPEPWPGLQRSPVHVALWGLVLGGGALALHGALHGALPERALVVLRHLVGSLPLIGFIGTIMGIMAAMRHLPAIFDSASMDQDALRGLLDGLALAFETTLIGAIGAVVIGGYLALRGLDDAG